MNISLTTELEQFIQGQVASGKYTSNEEVILAGIRLLEERERIYKGRFEELQREIAILKLFFCRRYLASKIRI
ncbi:hypothetical protein A6769_04275 [Nostoc punctiforme NIES-2108]|uniref:CopG family transcriptional regulator n=1 Tax=Nostoc punctiforme NIES-2108 TaxID=1356359 RepID=A0A367RTE3_NOSPU|nr:hypothetical protein A6769_04275 [Nostoc punctiforme NIES-2108]